MINEVVLNGRLTKEADLRFTASGQAVANFKLAVERNFTNAEGEREVDYIACVMWGKRAEGFAEHTYQGSLVSVSGRIQTRNYDNKEGLKVYVTEVVADTFQFLEPKSVTDERRQKAGAKS